MCCKVHTGTICLSSIRDGRLPDPESTGDSEQHDSMKLLYASVLVLFRDGQNSDGLRGTASQAL